VCDGTARFYRIQQGLVYELCHDIEESESVVVRSSVIMKQEMINERCRRLGSKCRVTLSYSGEGYSSGAQCSSFVLLRLMFQKWDVESAES